MKDNKIHIYADGAHKKSIQAGNFHKRLAQDTGSQKNIAQAARYYLLRTGDYWVSLLCTSMLGLGFWYVLKRGLLTPRGEPYILLVLYSLHLGLSFIASNAMVVNLTIKDVQSKRIEFLLSSGIDMAFLIHTYTFEMWRLGSLGPGLFYILILMFFPFQDGIWPYILIFITSNLLCYAETLFLNVTAFTRKNFKLYRQMILFLGCLFIFLLGNGSTLLLDFLNQQGLSLASTLIAVNSLLAGLFMALSFPRLRKISSEVIFHLERL